jgi:DNA invertase Pin-like site-specific DNA recombinase
MKKPQPSAFSYVRFSSPKQSEGDSLRRQVEAAADWCQRHGYRLDTSTTLHDLGKSAFTGSHRQNPDRHALASFLKLVEQGRVVRGSALVVEALDRLSREHIRPALSLLLSLIEAGVRVVQLKPVEKVYDEHVEPMDLMLALMELSRGHSESAMKSDRVGAAWQQKKKRARENGEPVTVQVPAWIERVGDKFLAIPNRAATVRKIFVLSAAGYGITQVSRKLTADGDEAFGSSGKWNRSYIDLILRDRRAVGEYSPKRVRGGKRAKDGDPIPGFYPVIVSPEEFDAARRGVKDRAKLVGRGSGDRVNIFRRLVRCAFDGSSYVECIVNRKGTRGRVLHNSHALEGRGPYHSFPSEVLEAAILKHTREIDAREVLGDNGGPAELTEKAAELVRVEADIAALESELEQGGDVPALARVLRKKEEQRADLATLVDDLRHQAAHPLGEAWAEACTLADVLAASKDVTDTRLRLRSAFRRFVSEIWLLVTGAGAVRKAAVQVYYKSGNRRDFLILFRPAHGPSGREAAWMLGAPSLNSDEFRALAKKKGDPSLLKALDLDLRNRGDARKLAAALDATAIDPDDVVTEQVVHAADEPAPKRRGRR